MITPDLFVGRPISHLFDRYAVEEARPKRVAGRVDNPRGGHDR